MDAVAVLNIGSWDTYVSKVINHTRGQDWFDFNNTWGHMEHLNAAKGTTSLEHFKSVCVVCGAITVYVHYIFYHSFFYFRRFSVDQVLRNN